MDEIPSHNAGPKSQTQSNTHIPNWKQGKLIHADDGSHNRGHSGVTVTGK